MARARPRIVTLIACVFLGAGVAGFLYHASEWQSRGGRALEPIWVLVIRAAAVVCGVLLLLGRNWARWLAVVWMAYHVVLSVGHSASGTAAHVMLMALIWYGLFRSRSAAYFSGDRTGP